MTSNHMLCMFLWSHWGQQIPSTLDDRRKQCLHGCWMTLFCHLSLVRLLSSINYWLMIGSDLHHRCWHSRLHAGHNFLCSSNCSRASSLHRRHRLHVSADRCSHDLCRSTFVKETGFFTEADQNIIELGPSSSGLTSSSNTILSSNLTYSQSQPVFKSNPHQQSKQN